MNINAKLNLEFNKKNIGYSLLLILFGIILLQLIYFAYISIIVLIDGVKTELIYTSVFFRDILPVFLGTVFSFVLAHKAAKIFFNSLSQREINSALLMNMIILSIIFWFLYLYRPNYSIIKDYIMWGTLDNIYDTVQWTSALRYKSCILSVFLAPRIIIQSMLINIYILLYSKYKYSRIENDK